MRRLLAITLSFLIILMPGCATPPPDRWLTQEEDAAMRAQCEPVGGCVLVPVGLWQQIESLLNRLKGMSI